VRGGHLQETHLTIAVNIRVFLAAQRVQVAAPSKWVAKTAGGQAPGNLAAKRCPLSFIPLIVIDLCR